MSLSSLIVQREVATIRQVEEALARQAIYGGDLATSLLEVVPVDEGLVTRLAGEAARLEVAGPGELVIAEERVLRRVPRELAERVPLVPLGLQGDRLVVAVAEPLSADVEVELRRACGAMLVQRLAPTARIFQALHRAYGLPLDRRLGRLLARLGGQVVASSAPALKLDVEVAPIPAARVPNTEELMSTPKGRRRRGPLPLEVASSEADRADDRDTLLDLLFDFARQFFDYTALFIVHGDVAEGRDAFGIGASHEQVCELRARVDSPGLFGKARELGGPVTSVAADDTELVSRLGRSAAARVFVVPVLVRARAVAFVWADCGQAGIDARSAGAVSSLAAIVGQALERLIVKRKLAGATVRPARVESERVVAKPEGLPSEPVVEETTEIEIAEVEMTEGELEDTGYGVRTPRTPFPPPPPMVTQVRRPSGPPIPREEPASRPGGPFEPLVIPPHRVPRSFPVAEPPVADAHAECRALVKRVLAGDTAAETALLRLGERAMPAIMERFPGNVEPQEVPSGRRPSECGPVLRLVARQRRIALPFLVIKARNGDSEARLWATQLLGELSYAEAIGPVLERLFDEEVRVGRGARVALTNMVRTLAPNVVAALSKLAFAEGESARDVADRVTVVEVLCELREATAVPVLVALLRDRNREVVAASRRALIKLTGQDFGEEASRWSAWWAANAPRHRIEWLIDALGHDLSDLQHAAHAELQVLTQQSFSADLGLPRDREALQQRYRTWWSTKGRVRFRGY